jgi:sugar transferase (PEP-CTERM/EpsH1 system associated)
MVSRTSPQERPLVAHVIFRLAIGGLENGLVNLLNRLPENAYRHAVISLTDATDFRERIQRDDVQIACLGKPPGHAFRIYGRLYRLFRELRPAIVHSRNLAALEAQLPAWAAGVPLRVHGEHGYTHDPGESGWRLRGLRRAHSPLVTRYVALSQELERYLVNDVGIAARRVERICNGVDAERFFPAPTGERQPIAGSPFNDPRLRLVGAVGRLQPIKDQVTLARAFCRALALDPAARDNLRLVLVGDGPLRAEIIETLESGGAAELAWLPGERKDVPDVLRGLDCFVLPSRGEGISNTVLEAMACALPVIATRVGGNAELVEEGVTGAVTPPADAEVMARAILGYASDRGMARRHGTAGRARVLSSFSMHTMVKSYHRLYQQLLSSRAQGLNPLSSQTD